MSLVTLLGASACFATDVPSSKKAVFSIESRGLNGAAVSINVAGSYTGKEGTGYLSCTSNQSDHQLTCGVYGGSAQISEVLGLGNFAINPAVHFKSDNSYINITYNKGLSKDRTFTYKPLPFFTMGNAVKAYDQTSNSVVHLDVDSSSYDPNGGIYSIIYVGGQPYSLSK